MSESSGASDRTVRWDNLKRPERQQAEINVGGTERVVSTIAGAALLVYSLRRRRLRALLMPLAGGLVKRGLTGVCEVNRAMGRNSAAEEGRTSPVASLRSGEGSRIEESVTILETPRSELFRFWRNFENLPRFMDNLESVSIVDDRRSHWVAKGALGTRVEWDAEIHNEIENELIAWRSLPGADVDQAGSVHFTPTPDGGTEVRVVMRYSPPGGRLGGAVASILGDDPARRVSEDLRRFKQVMEAGESAPSAATAGQV